MTVKPGTKFPRKAAVYYPAAVDIIREALEMYRQLRRGELKR